MTQQERKEMNVVFLTRMSNALRKRLEAGSWILSPRSIFHSREKQQAQLRY